MNKVELLILLLCITLLRVLEAAVSGRIVEKGGKEFRVVNELPSNYPECKQVNGDDDWYSCDLCLNYF